MMLPTAKIQGLLANPFLPAVSFLAGVTYDTLTLTRIDRLLDNLILLLYLSLLGTLIILTGRMAMGMSLAGLSTRTWAIPHLLDRACPYYPMALHFLLGGLFSAYAIFYLRSTSLTTTAVFFGVVLAFLIANEFLRDRLSSLKLLVSLYALVTFTFFTLFLPVLTGLMNTAVFLVGAALSMAVVIRVVQLIYKGVPVQTRREPVWTTLPALGVIGVLVGFYFLNWIPPVPLSLKFGGMYHNVTKVDGTYQLTFEKGSWFQFWKRSDDTFHKNEPAYCFTAVFAPVRLDTTIYHHWQYRPVVGGDTQAFMTTDRIAIDISGGREKGYRAYTIKSRVAPGEWRVDVETDDGRVIGRVTFQVEDEEPREMEAISY